METLSKMHSAFQHSCDGLRTAWADDASYRRAVVQVILAIFIAILLRIFGLISYPALAILAVSQLPIIIVELLNCAVEAVTDKASPNYHPLAKKAKDIGSAAVLMARVMALLIWLAVLLPAAA
jgi:diacylglycerol kinase (ATP)